MDDFTRTARQVQIGDQGDQMSLWKIAQKVAQQFFVTINA
jgi:uncharacterized protein YabE (DUF348 family)